MIASMFGSKDLLNYILQKGSLDIDRASGSDGLTALHCAAAGGSFHAYEVIKLLLDSRADLNRVDVNGNRPADVISPCFDSSSKSKRKTLKILLNKIVDHVEQEGSSPKSNRNGVERKEYPIDPSLPDIKNGVYGTDEFRMYTFKIKPCSRAYSHDWTECPFVHPGENARRRDPRKYHYSCVPCPEFRKEGSCPKGDACEYAHGIFECWLHPAQYRTRLCKDETGCTRRVCFFAHKPEELRPLYASTGSGVPSPRSFGLSSASANSFDLGSMSPSFGLSSPSMLMGSTSTPPMSPILNGGSSPIAGASAWASHLNLNPPPTLQLPGSRLKAALSARDMNLEAEFRRHQLLDELAGLSLSSPSSWNRGTLQMNYQQLCPSYSSGMPSSPVRAPPSFGIERCGSPISNPRVSAFANRSHSFIDRGGLLSPTSSNAMTVPPHLSDWGSPDGKVDWGVQGDELNKLRKSASFGVRTNGTHISGNPNLMRNLSNDQPDVSQVQSPTAKSAELGFEDQLKEQYHLNGNGSNTMIPPWVEQFYMEQEPMVA